MLILLPIRTEVRPRKRPLANYGLIGLNMFIFMLTDLAGGRWGMELKAYYMLDPAWPALFQYITYQFLHGDITHLLGNMLFLWIFGNAVCDRMGGRAYLLFYLAGGVFAGIVFASAAENPMLGASGSIAAVTTAFLVLYPRVHIVMLAWVIYLITTFQLPATILIVVKIILWDNIIAPSLEQSRVANVAYSAHLGGYAFGFLIGMLMLAAQALPRNQFDLLALWGRWRRRQGYTPTSTARPHAYRPRPIHVEELVSEPTGTLELTPAEQKRETILDLLEAGRMEDAARDYRELLEMKPDQVLPRRQQLDLANHFNQTQCYEEAVAAYEALLSAYPTAPETAQVQLLVGLICNRYLDRPNTAIDFLKRALSGLTIGAHRELAEQELRTAEARLSGPSNPTDTHA